jgi:hypothetical protein
MSIFSSISKSVSDIWQGVSEAFVGQKDVNKYPRSQLTQDVAENVSALIGGTKAATAVQASGIVASSGIGSTAVSAAKPITAPFATSTYNVVKTAILNNPIKSLFAAPLILGAVARNPTKVVELPNKYVSSAFNFGGNISDLASNPTIEQAKKTFKEDPILTSLTGAAIIGGVGYGASNLIATVANTSAIKKNTAVTTLTGGSIGSSDSSIGDVGTNKYDVKVAKVNAKAKSDIPVAAAAAPTTAVATPKKKVKKKKKATPKKKKKVTKKKAKKKTKTSKKKKKKKSKR